MCRDFILAAQLGRWVGGKGRLGGSLAGDLADFSHSLGQCSRSKLPTLSLSIYHFFIFIQLLSASMYHPLLKCTALNTDTDMELLKILTLFVTESVRLINPLQSLFLEYAIHAYLIFVMDATDIVSGRNFSYVEKFHKM